jgi:glycosyltransferase involved in cell wall biosynthesis
MTASQPRPRVSVISIFFNAEPYLCEALDSVLAQDWQDFELLLVDDGSTDASQRIARDYARRHASKIRYLAHPGHRNRGISASRNLGLAAASGEFVAFIDADDRWSLSKLREQLEVFDRHPEVDAVCGAVNYWSSWRGGKDRVIPTGHVQDRPVPSPQAVFAVYPLGRSPAPCPSDLMLRRSAIAAVGGFEDRFTGLYEDQAFLAKFYLEKTIFFARSIWLDYRQHDESCLAEAVRAGDYLPVRSLFLDWFDHYVARSRHRFRLPLRIALWRARFPGRYPRLAATLRRVRHPALREAAQS